MSRDDAGLSIARAYQKAIEDRGFRLIYKGDFEVYTRTRGRTCDSILLGSPYLPPEERRQKIVLEFQHDRVPAKECVSA